MAPYPEHLATLETTRDGMPIALRPVRPDDEPRLQDLFAHMSGEDVRRRFFVSMRELNHAFAARLARLDYDREMALLAEHDGLTLGVGRYAAEADRHSGEFALAVRSDWKGHGVGYVLLRRLIEIAREAGLGELVGAVIAENAPMLAMCRDFGFTRERDAGDASVVRVRKRLAPDGSQPRPDTVRLSTGGGTG
ncbi:MAG: GNAT family N-acetyltransferase [Alphaproteobacteria bacterium]|nr:GNAT family N-acetyltransferase [Alphaproteobacteria bacterium]